MPKLKASVVISFVLVVGIGIALVATAYIWGKPILEKRTTITEFSAVKSFMEDLNRRISDIANSQSGEFSLNIPVGSISVEEYNPGDPPGSNNITLTFSVPQPLILEGGITYLGVTTYSDIINKTGTFGESSPGILSLESERTSQGFFLSMKLHFRELDTEDRGFLIALEGGISAAGENRIIVSFDTVQTAPQQAANGGPLELIKIKVTVS